MFVVLWQVVKRLNLDEAELEPHSSVLAREIQSATERELGQVEDDVRDLHSSVRDLESRVRRLERG